MSIKRQFFIFLYFLVFIFSLTAFSQKKYLKPEEYHQWSSLQRTTLSKDGNWVSYNVTNEHVYKTEKSDYFRDTLELVELKSLERFIYPFGSNPNFSRNSRWFTFLQNNQWVQVDLKNKREKRLDSVVSYEQFSNGLVSLVRIENKPYVLQLVEHGDLNVVEWKNILSYTFHPDGKSVLLYQKENEYYRLLLVNTDTPKSFQVLKSTPKACSQFRWSNSGDKLAFYEQVEKKEYQDYRLHVLDLKDAKKNMMLDSNALPDGFYLNSHAVTFTANENKLNLLAFPIDDGSKPIDPLIWRSKDPVQPPVENNSTKRIVISWEFDTYKLKVISDKEYFMASGDLEHFFWLEDSNYLPSFKYGAFLYDIVYKNGETGETKLLQDNFRIQDRVHMLSVSPVGRYIAWNQEDDWWVYDIEKEEKHCVTCETGEAFSMPFDSDNNLFKPYGGAYFSKDNQDLILTSKNKVWKYDLENNKIKLLLKNNNHDVHYTVIDDSSTNSLGTNYLSFRNNAIDYVKGLFIKEYNLESQEETLFLYQGKNKPKKIVSSANRITYPEKNGESIIYCLSNYDVSPQLIHWSKGGVKTIYQGNKQQEKYYWGHSELLSFRGIKGGELKGALFYPGNYDPEKKYPVMINIYSEVALHNLKRYVPPTLENFVAWNTSVFTTQDYFVFMPDIEYEINYTGQSALECVLAGVEAIRDIPGVDTSRMGLFGQSFAGFEVSYIATQTDAFKAIFSSAGWHDLVDAYTTIDDNRNFNYFRFEHHQLRIKAPYYSKTFLDNSPILQAYKINTPMLLLAGTKDRRVYWENSMKMQLALTRLGKKSTFLLYKDEGHVLRQQKNQIDATIKMLEWFNYHLKGAEEPSWN